MKKLEICLHDEACMHAYDSLQFDVIWIEMYARVELLLNFIVHLLCD